MTTAEALVAHRNNAKLCGELVMGITASLGRLRLAADQETTQAFRDFYTDACDLLELCARRERAREWLHERGWHVEEWPASFSYRWRAVRAGSCLYQATVILNATDYDGALDEALSCVVTAADWENAFRGPNP
jgi:hypothetical protein